MRQLRAVRGGRGTLPPDLVYINYQWKQKSLCIGSSASTRHALR